jgi:hypothetical protein
MKSEQLLREYVLRVLSEDDGGVYGDLASFDAGMNPYGMNLGSGEDLYNVFVKPFADVATTAMGKGKELSQHAQTVVKVAFEAVATSIIPILSDSYSEIFAKEKERIDKIREEYKDVYQSNWDAFKDDDVMCTAFCYAPAAVLTARLAKKSPKVAIAMISALSGGTLDPWLEKVKHAFGITDKEEEPKTGLNFSGEGPGMGPVESVVREDANGGERPKPDISELLSSDKLHAKLQNSPIVQRMEQEGKALVRNTLQQVFKQAQGVMKATSLQDLQNKTGTHLKGMDKLNKVPQQERKAAEQAILSSTKKAMKAFYTKNLEAQVKQAIQAGVPQDSPYVQDIQTAISHVKAL